MNNSGGSATASAYWSSGEGYMALSGTALAGSQYNIGSEVEYYFQVSNPNQAYPPLNVSLTAAGSASQTGNAGASGYIEWASVPFGWGSGTAFTVNSGGSSTFSGTVSLPVYANIEYEVILHANCTAGGESGDGPWVAGSANVLIDPILTISQTYVNEGYTLTVSPDLSPARLPTSVPLSLSPGWNLVSLLLQPAKQSIASVLSGITDYVEVVWAYPNQTWQLYDPNDAAGSTLTTMQAGTGYWIKMASEKTLTVSGSAPPSSLQLSSGWNLVGYNGTSCKAASTALQGLTGLQVSWGYPSQAWQFYDPNNSSGFLSNLCPSAGYWININQGTTWSGW